jgi:hypothetical protein
LQKEKRRLDRARGGQVIETAPMVTRQRRAFAHFAQW